MPITVKYGPDASVLGQVAFQAGQGAGARQDFAQALDLSRFFESRRQFDQSLAQRVWSQRFATEAQERQQLRGIQAQLYSQNKQIAARERSQAFDAQVRGAMQEQELTARQQSQQAQIAASFQQQQMRFFQESALQQQKADIDNQFRNAEFEQWKEKQEFEIEGRQGLYRWQHTFTQQQKLAEVQRKREMLADMRMRGKYSPRYLDQVERMLQAQEFAFSQPVPMPAPETTEDSPPPRHFTLPGSDGIYQQFWDPQTEQWEIRQVGDKKPHPKAGSGEPFRVMGLPAFMDSNGNLQFPKHPYFQPFDDKPLQDFISKARDAERQTWETVVDALKDDPTWIGMSMDEKLKKLADLKPDYGQYYTLMRNMLQDAQQRHMQLQQWYLAQLPDLKGETLPGFGDPMPDFGGESIPEPPDEPTAPQLGPDATADDFLNFVPEMLKALQGIQ